jgi:hypothetical protein
LLIFVTGHEAFLVESKDTRSLLTIGTNNDIVVVVVVVVVVGVVVGVVVVVVVVGVVGVVDIKIVDIFIVGVGAVFFKKKSDVGDFSCRMGSVSAFNARSAMASSLSREAPGST